MQFHTRSHFSHRYRQRHRQHLRLGLGQRHSYTAGFTLLEMIIVLAIIGSLMAIAAPGWLTIADQRRLTSSQDKVVQAMRLAQSRAEQLRVSWQTSLREINGTVQVSAHPVDSSPDLTGWENLATGIELDVAETTLPQSNGVYQVQFNSTGRVNGQLGRFTVKGKRTSQLKQCVIVSTLLGAVRRGQNQTTPDATGRYCY